MNSILLKDIQPLTVLMVVVMFHMPKSPIGVGLRSGDCMEASALVMFCHFIFAIF